MSERGNESRGVAPSARESAGGPAAPSGNASAGASAGASSPPRRRFAIAMVAACPFPSPRGTPLRIEKLAGALAARGHEVHVVTYHLAVGDAPLGVQVHRTRALPFRGALAPGPTFDKLAILDPLLAGRLRGVLARHAIDVVHAHHYEGLAVALAAVRAARTDRGERDARGARNARGAGEARRPAPPVVYDAHTLLASELPEYKLPLPRAVTRGLGAFIDGRLPRRAAHVVAVTERLRARLVAEFGVAASRASVVSNGVERAFYDACGRAIAAREATRAESPLPPPPPRAATLVFSGNLAAYQGVDLMLEAFAAVRRERGGARLVMLPAAGVDAAAIARAREAAARHGVADAVEIAQCAAADLPARLAAADIALSPRPRADGLPMKVLNYMAAALPTIAFRDAAGPLEDGRTGLLVDELSAAAFARAVVRVLDDRALAERLGRAARETIAARYTWEAAAASLEALYASLVAARAGVANSTARAITDTPRDMGLDHVETRR